MIIYCCHYLILSLTHLVWESGRSLWSRCWTTTQDQYILSSVLCDTYITYPLQNIGEKMKLEIILLGICAICLGFSQAQYDSDLTDQCIGCICYGSTGCNRDTE
jgi:hypothetical protein